MFSLRRPRWSIVFKQLVLALAYATLAKYSLDFFSERGNISIIWPCSGLALAALLRGGRQYAWGILLGALLINLHTNTHTISAVSIAIGNTLEAVVAAWLLKRVVHFDQTIATLKDYLHLILLAAALGSLVAALMGTTTLLWAGFLPPSEYLVGAAQWWMGDALGIVVVTPFLLLWSTPLATTDWQKLWWKYALIMSGTFIAGQIILYGCLPVWQEIYRALVI